MDEAAMAAARSRRAGRQNRVLVLTAMSGAGHFYFAKNREYSLCVYTRLTPLDKINKKGINCLTR
jgi:hypothetical protein